MELQKSRKMALALDRPNWILLEYGKTAVLWKERTSIYQQAKSSKKVKLEFKLSYPKNDFTLIFQYLLAAQNPLPSIQFLGFDDNKIRYYAQPVKNFHHVYTIAVFDNKLWVIMGTGSDGRLEKMQQGVIQHPFQNRAPNGYLVSYNHGKDVKKEYRAQIRKGNLKRNLRIGMDGNKI